MLDGMEWDAQASTLADKAYNNAYIRIKICKRFSKFIFLNRVDG